MKKLIFILLILLYPAIPPYVQMCAYAQNYRLGPDDALKVTVYREEELDRDMRVSSDGYISFPLLGKVKAEGLTVSELENELTKGLRRYLKKPQVTVFIDEYSEIVFIRFFQRHLFLPSIISALSRTIIIRQTAIRSIIRAGWV